MSPLHGLLKRQLRRFADETIPLLEEQIEFIKAVNEAYWQFDADRKMLEHSLELTSQELLERNAELARINTDLERRVTIRTEELSGSEARFRGLFQHVPVSIWEEDFSAVRQYIDNLRSAEVVDFSTYFNEHPEEVEKCAALVKIVDVNCATLEMYQAESKEQLLVELSKVLGSESLIKFKEELLALIHGDLLFETEIINYTLKGQKRSVFLRLTLAPGYEQTWTKVFVGISDVTERRKAEEALQQSEERFKLMAWATKDAVWDWDLRTNQIWWGEGLQKIFHYSSEMTQTDVRWWSEHIHPEDLIKVTRAIDQALEGGMEFWSKEYRFQRKDGTYADIMDRGYVLRDEMGKPYRMVGAMMDITERKFMELKLVESNQQMKQIVDELQRRNNDIALLNEMGRLLHSCQSTQEAYGIIGKMAHQLFPRTIGALYLLNKSRSAAKAVASWGELPWVEQMFTTDDCWSLRNGQTQPLHQDRIGRHCIHISEPEPAISYCLLIQVQGEILGTLHMRSQHKEDLDDIKRQLAYSVAEQTGMALSNLNLRAALREQSIRDPLTGLYNRRYMEEALKQQLSRVTRHISPLAIIMIDIDHFKNFNDTFGHAAGDLLLIELGHSLQSHIRGEDIACRYGGEEFMLIMPDISLDIAYERAEHLRREAKLLQVKDNDKLHLGNTLSLGVAVYPFHGETVEATMRAADAALYRAKQEGRDRVIVAEKAALV